MDRDAWKQRLRRSKLAGALGFALLLGGCAAPLPHPAQPPPPPQPPARPLPGYEGLVDSLDAIDPSALAGKRIAIDPGHGGYFPGSLGVRGLTEAAVNLGVALELERLLSAHGAQVLLTRREDRDFLTGADSSLRADLTERVRRANLFHPDLFLSIHHNADPGGAHDRNETQTYYKLGDEGPSLDAAALLHRYLKRNVGIEKHRIVPGNYFVLRNSEAPAVLTEASYLTNPDVEALLALEEKRRLEADALYLGLAHFFTRRAPVIERFSASAEGAGADTLFRELNAPRLTADISGAFDRADLEVDGEPVEPIERGPALVWDAPRALPAGRHEASLRVALAGAGAARERRLSFTIERRPASLSVRMVPPGGPRLRGLRIELLDRAGLPSADSLALVVRALRPGVSPAETTVVARDGVAWAYLRLGPAAVRATGPLVKVAPAAGSVPRGVTVVGPGPRSGGSAPWTGWALRMPEGKALRDAPGTREPAWEARWINRDGFVVMERDSAGAAPAPRLPGYRAWAADTALPPRFVAVAGGMLHGRRIVLDPDGGGEDSGGMGPSGTRAAFYNMDVARALASFLTAAGAGVRLARTTDVAASEVERVRAGEVFHAERYLRIGHRAEPPHVGYYFASAAGKRWAQRTALWLARLGLPSPPVRDDAQYPLQQSSATALYVATARVDDAASEGRMNMPGAARAEAYALFLGLADEWAPNGAWPADSLQVRDPQGRPAAGALVTLGDAMILQADAAGVVRFARTEPGPLEVRVEHPGLRVRAILLDSDRGVVLIGHADR
jgi:N-acetylmuramoyl-L-alanine amidase